ncbi:MAG: hypothetical protein H7Z16_15970 [Pyrinomonadaceae bacterium]|nr:hypothetical protein [Pyrinomonadaceae bacterium]
MKRRLSAILFLLAVFWITAAQTPRPTNAKLRRVTGQYRFRQDELRNSLDVLQLAGGKIKFQLVALWVSHNNPENIHNGELRGVVALENGLAVYESGNCRITMKFTSNGVAITESDENSDCGFGVNVTAAGPYRKTGSRKPKFDF